ATSLAAGSVGTLVALWRDKTFPALATTFIFLVLYLILARGLPLLISEDGSGWIEQARAWIDPFEAMNSIQQPPEPGFFLPTAYGYVLVMGLLAVLLNLWGIWKLRVWNPSGEPIMQREAHEEPETETDKEKRRNIHAAPGKV